MADPELVEELAKFLFGEVYAVSAKRWPDLTDGARALWRAHAEAVLAFLDSKRSEAR